jgi:hypothetical protein
MIECFNAGFGCIPRAKSENNPPNVSVERNNQSIVAR